MSWQSAILLGWTAVHGYFAVFCAGIWLAQPKDRHALVLLGLVASMAAFICVGILRDHAGSAEQAIALSHLRALLSAAQAGLFADCVARFLGGHGARRAVVRMAYAVLALTALASVFFGLYEPLAEGQAFQPGWIPRPRPARMWLAGLALPAPAFMAVQVGRAAGHLPGGRAFAATLTIALGCAVHDLIARYFGLSPFHVLDHALVLVSGVLTHLLLLQSQEVSTRLQRQNRALGEQMAAIAQTRDALRETAPLAAVGELAARLAKEVDGPLCAVREGTAALEQRADAAAWQRVDGAIGRLDRLVDNLLGQTRQVAPARVWTPLSELLQEAVDGCRVLREHRPRIELTRAVQAAELLADPVLMHDALGALIDAVRERDGKVWLQADRDRERGGVVIWLWIDGPAERQRSLGLALPYAARVLAAHGGEVDALLGERQAVRVWFPAAAYRSAEGDAA